MAVCGCCWICCSKFDCGRGFECEGCAPNGGGPVVVEHSIEGHSMPTRICRNCVELIDKGVVGNLIEALRSAIS